MFLIGRPKSKTGNARSFAAFGKIQQKERIAIYCHINPRTFQRTIEKIWLHFQKDVICRFII
jgi:hypothetical protein